MMAHSIFSSGTIHLASTPGFGPNLNLVKIPELYRRRETDLWQPLSHVTKNLAMFWPECDTGSPLEPHNDHDNTDTHLHYFFCGNVGESGGLFSDDTVLNHFIRFRYYYRSEAIKLQLYRKLQAPFDHRIS